VVREVVTKISDERTNKVGEVEFEIRILIHQSHAGAIIGKGGAKIKGAQSIEFKFNYVRQLQSCASRRARS